MLSCLAVAFSQQQIKIICLFQLFRCRLGGVFKTATKLCSQPLQADEGVCCYHTVYHLGAL